MGSTSFSIPPFAAKCKQNAKSAFGESFQHPFVRALADGTLEPSKFRFYQMQDARYLEAFSDATALLSTRCVSPKDKLWFLEAAKMALVVESELHAGYGKKLGYTDLDIARMELSPNNRAYQNHMVSAATKGSLLEGIAAMAPCPWLYIELGQHLKKELGTIPDTHPFADWLNLYSDPGFNDYMNALLDQMERASLEAGKETQDRALEAFLVSVRYEWMFWDQAWNFQSWPV